MWLFPIERQRQWHARRLGIPNAVISPAVTVETTHRKLSRECRGKSRLWEPSDDGTALTGLWVMERGSRQRLPFILLCAQGEVASNGYCTSTSAGAMTRADSSWPLHAGSS